MQNYGLIACFSWVIKNDIGEHKFDGTVRQKLGVGKWKKKKSWFWPVAKTGNIGKESPVTGNIDYVRYLGMQKVNTKVL